MVTLSRWYFAKASVSDNHGIVSGLDLRETEAAIVCRSLALRESRYFVQMICTFALPITAPFGSVTVHARSLNLAHGGCGDDEYRDHAKKLF